MLVGPRDRTRMKAAVVKSVPFNPETLTHHRSYQLNITTDQSDDNFAQRPHIFRLQGPIDSAFEGTRLSAPLSLFSLSLRVAPNRQ